MILMTTPHLIQLPKFLDDRGNLSFLENDAQLPFEIQRVHWIYDVPGGEERGGVAYRETEEFIIAMSGSFDVIVDDGKERSVTPLNRSYMGVYVPKGTWRSIENFSTNSLALICASTHYDPQDGIRDYAEFKRYASNVSLYLSLTEKKSLHSNNVVTESIPLPFRDGSGGCIIDLDRHHSNRKGDICVVENGETIPFNVKRVYYLYDVPGGVSRGGHAHRNLSQLIVAASGSFTVTLDDGKHRQAYTLNRPYQGLLVTPGIWRTLDDFSSGSVCMVLASEIYSEDDYIRDYDEFLKYKGVKE